MSGPAAARTAWQRLGVAAASAGGLGRFPVAPGTVGSAAGIGVYLLLPPAAAGQAMAILGVLLVGLWASCTVASCEAQPDPSYVVIDEVAGMLIGCCGLPRSLPHLGAAFLLFRLFDIGKWFPMKQLERLPGGWGVMADDVAAGCLTWLVLIPWR